MATRAAYGMTDRNRANRKDNNTMAKCNTDQLLAPELERYLDKRRDELSTDLDHMVRIISKPGGDTHDNLRHRLVLTARLAELDALRQTMMLEEVARRQKDLDEHPGPSLKILPLP